jgi:hypothetical protein
MQASLIRRPMSVQSLPAPVSDSNASGASPKWIALFPSLVVSFPFSSLLKVQELFLGTFSKKSDFSLNPGRHAIIPQCMPDTPYLTCMDIGCDACFSP